MGELILKKAIEQMIFSIRGRKVMLSNHLADLYGVTTSALMQAVRRNIERFPEDFMFSLTRSEIVNLSQIVISSKIKHAPEVYAFTEQGVAMISSVLRSQRAVQVNIAIMRTFVKLRKFFLTNKELVFKLRELERKVEDHDTDIKDIFEALRYLTGLPADRQKITGFTPK